MSGNELTTNANIKPQSSTISAKELLATKTKLIERIDNSKIDGNSEIIIGFNASLEDIKNKVNNVVLPTTDVTPDSKDYLDTLEIMYLIGTLSKSVDNVVATFKVIGGKNNGR